MAGLTDDERRVAHACASCGHLLTSHDGAGCVKCLNEWDRDGRCERTPHTFETTYESIQAVVAAREAAAEERGRAEVRAAVEAVRSDADWLADWSHNPPAGVLFGDLARMTRLAYGVRAALGGDPAAAVAAIKAEALAASNATCPCIQGDSVNPDPDCWHWLRGEAGA